MARDSKYKVQFRRRRESLTNYYKRRKLLLSGKPWLVARVTNRYVIVQIVEAKPQGTVTMASAHSGELREYGWKGGTKTTPSAYLVGLLIGFRALERGVEEAILDIGLRRPTRGARVFAVAKGAVDAGLKVPLSEEVVPDDDRISGLHIASYARILREQGLLEKRLSEYLERGLEPENIPEHFKEVKERIIAAFSATSGALREQGASPSATSSA